MIPHRSHLDAAFTAHGADLAAVLVEPVAANMGLVAPATGFLAGLRRRCSDAGALLVFDEVITGFRISRGGAQEMYGITPDGSQLLGQVTGGSAPTVDGWYLWPGEGGVGSLLDLNLFSDGSDQLVGTANQIYGNDLASDGTVLGYKGASAAAVRSGRRATGGGVSFAY